MLLLKWLVKWIGVLRLLWHGLDPWQWVEHLIFCWTQKQHFDVDLQLLSHLHYSFVNIHQFLKIDHTSFCEVGQQYHIGPDWHVCHGPVSTTPDFIPGHKAGCVTGQSFLHPTLLIIHAHETVPEFKTKSMDHFRIPLIWSLLSTCWTEHVLRRLVALTGWTEHVLRSFFALRGLNLTLVLCILQAYIRIKLVDCAFYWHVVYWYDSSRVSTLALCPAFLSQR